MKKKIYCFDFDGTLTTSDTLLEFIRYAKGTGRFLMVFLMYSPHGGCQHHPYEKEDW